MKRCPQCNRVETDDALVFCRADGAALVSDSSPPDREAGTARLGTASEPSEIETSILPHATHAGAKHSTAPTTVLPPPQVGKTNPLNRLTRRKTAIAVIVVFVAMAAVISALVANSYRSRKADASIESIAVLPFENQNNDPTTDYFSDGITESIINSLSQLPNLKVMGRTTVFRYKGRDADAQNVGKQLGVAAILTGKVLRQGDTISIQADLVRVSDGTEIWGEKYTRKLADIFAVQSDLAREITDRLRLQLSGVQRERLTKHSTENTEAYELYLKGRYHHFKGSETEVTKAADYYRQAIAKDPNYALAYVGLADTYGFNSSYVFPPTEAYAHVKEAVQRALQLDDGLAEAHSSWGTYKLFYERDWAGAESQFRRAIALNPNSADAPVWYSFYLEAMGRFDEAIAQANRARQLDPLGVFSNIGIAQAYYDARQYDRAIDAYRSTLEVDQENATIHVLLGQVYRQKSMYSEAVAACEKARKIENNPWNLAWLGYMYGAASRTADARKALAELEEMAKHRYVSPYNNALIYIGLGDKDQAFAWLNKADEERNDYLIYLKVEPAVDSLRSDPRFDALLRRIGLTR